MGKKRRMTFSEVEKYLKNKGLRNQIDYNIAINIEVVELNINGFYFCSVGKYTDNSFEVFEHHHGAQMKTEKNILLTANYGNIKFMTALKEP